MTGRTHDLAAITLLNLVFVSYPLPSMTLATTVVAFGAACIGGLTPDIDQPTADLYNRIPGGSVIGRMISPILGSHRMISHSIIGTGLAAFLSKKLCESLASIILVDMQIVWYAFMIGFISHLLVDVITRDGLPLFFPLPFRFGIPPLARFRLKTGGFIEKTIIYPVLLAMNAYLVYIYHDVYLSFLKQYIH